MIDIEKIGVLTLSSFVARSSILDPDIRTNDKTISFDGNINVFENDKREKEFYLGTIPVQVKSTHCSSFSDESVSHKFEVSDLKNYLKAGGAILFVVEVNGKSCKFFFLMLLPSDLKEILTKKGGKKSRYLNLSHLRDDNSNQIENICKVFLFHRKLQISTIENTIPISELVEINIPIILDDTPITDYVLKHEFYAYGKRQSDTVNIFIEKVRIEEIGRIIEKPISIDDKRYFQHYEYKKSKKVEEVNFGKGIRIDLTNSQVIYDLQGTINEQILDCEFLNELINRKTLFIGEHKEDFISFDGFLNKDELLLQINKIEKYLKDIKALLELFQIEPDKLDIYNGSVSRLDSISAANLDFLIRVFIKHEQIPDIPSGNGFYYLQVSSRVRSILNAPYVFMKFPHSLPP